METATVLIIFITSVLIGLTGYSIYTAFGPNSKSLRDPFEDHGVICFQSKYLNWSEWIFCTKTLKFN
jgi:PsbN protein